MRTVVLVTSIIWATTLFCLACPTSLNCIPTAETLDSGSVLLEFTNYGYSGVFSTQSTSGILCQLGLGTHMELGVDHYENEDSAENYFNAKLKLFAEGSRHPAVAVGMMDLSRGNSPTFYGVASKQIGNVRFHAGIIRASYSHGMIAGVDLDISDKLWFGLDYLPGIENHWRVGISRAVGADSWLLFTLGVPNNRDAASTECGITFSTTLSFGNK
ncbi:MAG: hypothetical protein ACUVRS_12530 [Armatimonadota bacterium]